MISENVINLQNQTRFPIEVLAHYSLCSQCYILADTKTSKEPTNIQLTCNEKKGMEKGLVTLK